MFLCSEYKEIQSQNVICWSNRWPSSQCLFVQVVWGQRSGVPAQVTDQGDVVGGVSHAGQSLVGGDLLVAGQRNYLLHLHKQQ